MATGTYRDTAETVSLVPRLLHYTGVYCTVYTVQSAILYLNVVSDILGVIVSTYSSQLQQMQHQNWGFF